MEQTDKTIIQEVGKRIARIRQAKKIGVRQLSFMLNRDTSWLCRIEKGRTNPTLLTLKIIADALNIELAELFED